MASVRAPTMASVIQPIALHPGHLVDREQRADVGEGKREDRVLDLHEPREAHRHRREARHRGRHACSFVFSTSTTSPMVICLSIALAMS